MSNMSYCRFRNTVNDLRDCADALEAVLSCDIEDGDGALSDDELDAAKRLVAMCARVVMLATEQIAVDGSDDIDALDAIAEIADGHGKASVMIDGLLDSANEALESEINRRDDESIGENDEWVGERPS